MQLTDKSNLNVKHSASCISQLPLETDKFGKLQVKSEPWHYNASEGRHYLAVFFLPFVCSHPPSSPLSWQSSPLFLFQSSLAPPRSRKRHYQIPARDTRSSSTPELEVGKPRGSKLDAVTSEGALQESRSQIPETREFMGNLSHFWRMVWGAMKPRYYWFYVLPPMGLSPYLVGWGLCAQVLGLHDNVGV